MEMGAIDGGVVYNPLYRYSCPPPVESSHALHSRMLSMLIHSSMRVLPTAEMTILPLRSCGGVTMSGYERVTWGIALTNPIGMSGPSSIDTCMAANEHTAENWKWKT